MQLNCNQYKYELLQGTIIDPKSNKESTLYL